MVWMRCRPSFQHVIFEVVISDWTMHYPHHNNHKMFVHISLYLCMCLCLRPAGPSSSLMRSRVVSYKPSRHHTPLIITAGFDWQPCLGDTAAKSAPFPHASRDIIVMGSIQHSGMPRACNFIANVWGWNQDAGDGELDLKVGLVWDFVQYSRFSFS